MNNKVFKIMLLQRGVKMQEIADWLGITLNTLYTRLSGKTTFDIKEVAKIKECLNLTKKEFSEMFPELMV